MSKIGFAAGAVFVAGTIAAISGYVKDNTQVYHASKLQTGIVADKNLQTDETAAYVDGLAKEAMTEEQYQEFSALDIDGKKIFVKDLLNRKENVRDAKAILILAITILGTGALTYCGFARDAKKRDDENAELWADNTDLVGINNRLLEKTDKQSEVISAQGNTISTQDKAIAQLKKTSEESYNRGWEEGKANEYRDGYDKGWTDGVEKGFNDGFEEGQQTAEEDLEDKHSECYEYGYTDGYQNGVSDCLDEALKLTEILE